MGDTFIPACHHHLLKKRKKRKKRKKPEKKRKKMKKRKNRRITGDALTGGSCS